MSVLVAIKDNDRVIFGCDTRMSGDGSYSDSYSERPKAYKLSKDTIVGVSGEGPVLDLILLHLSNEILNCKSRMDVVMIAQKLRLLLEDSCYVDSSGILLGSVLITIRNKIYEIAGNYDVFEKNEYAAIGCGKDYALSSLYSTRELRLTPLQRLQLAFKSSYELNVHISDEIYVADTKGVKFYKI